MSEQKAGKLGTVCRLKDLTTEELHLRFAELGVPIALTRQVQIAALRKGTLPGRLPGHSSKLLRAIGQIAEIPHLVLLEKSVSPQDGFAKYLFRGEEAEPFEAVRIPLLHRPQDAKYVVCVSSQVGCGLGCAFCATGRLGLRRNLATWEIVDQVIKIQADSPHPVRGVVFMGMGEPMFNYDRVLRAAKILSEPCGLAISGKAVTISTAGVVPGIRRFTAERHPYRLVVSLTSADPDRRAALMPIEKTYPLDELMQSVRDYHRASGRRVTLAWTMISGMNTRREDARALARLIDGLPITLDLIDVNDPTGRFRPPSREELNAFRDDLRELVAMPVARRYSGGQDIAGGCGMLAGRP
jgi:23S rRNA (adenine2503-C2)-methyltransferase